MQIKEILQKATLQLKQSNIGTAGLDARLLLQHAANISQETVFLKPELEISSAIIDGYQILINRRILNEPVAKIIGKKSFWKSDFFVNQFTLDPRPDSEIIIETALKIFPDKNAPLKFLDLGVGSGCLILSLLQEFPQATGVAVDISKQALEMAKQNASALGLENRIEFLQQNWADGLVPFSSLSPTEAPNPLCPSSSLTEAPKTLHLSSSMTEVLSPFNLPSSLTEAPKTSHLSSSLTEAPEALEIGDLMKNSSQDSRSALAEGKLARNDERGEPSLTMAEPSQLSSFLIKKEGPSHISSSLTEAPKTLHLSSSLTEAPNPFNLSSSLTEAPEALEIGDLMKNSSQINQFDLIISNPPYIPSSDIQNLSVEVKGYDPILALDGGEDGLNPYRYLAKQISKILKPNSCAILEFGYDQGEKVKEIFTNNHYNIEEILFDLSGNQRAIRVSI